MQTCRHCGKENQDTATLCSECGLELGDSPLERAAQQLGEKSGRFFRWRPASVILIILTVLYAVSVPLNVFLAFAAQERGDSRLSSFMMTGAFWNAVVAACCFFARRFMKKQERQGFLVGAGLAAAALAIVGRTWLGALLSGRNPFPVFEAILIGLPLSYAMFYALRESGPKQGAE